MFTIVDLTKEKKLDKRWFGFKKGSTKVSNRFTAQCAYCFGKLQGRPQYFPGHVTGCAVMPQMKKLEYWKKVCLIYLSFYFLIFKLFFFYKFIFFLD